MPTVEVDVTPHDGRHGLDYVRGAPREQTTLFPKCLDEYFEQDHVIRLVDRFVAGLDMTKAGFTRSVPPAMGRCPYDPRDLLKLYIYGYMNHIRSGRRLEKEAGRNLEVMWLLNSLKPDFKTICDFRKDNRKAFKEAFREFNRILKQLDVFGGQIVAVDGSRFKAVNSPRRNFTKGQLKSRLKEIDESIDRFVEALDAEDAKEVSCDGEPAERELQAKIRHLSEGRERYGKLLTELEQSGENQISLTDPDSRSTAKEHTGDVGYNAQIVVDDKHNLIVAQDVTNEINDTQQLSKMSIEAKEALGAEELKVVADTGYYNGPQIKACEDSDIEAYVSKRPTSKNASQGLFGKDAFTYYPETDVYHCPAGEVLTFRRVFQKSKKGPGSAHFLAEYGTAACGACKLRSQCTTRSRRAGGRRIRRWVDEDVLERMEKRVSANPELMKRRKAIVEHPFGTMKFWNDQSHFLVRRLGKVKAEFSLMTLAYNIKRAVKILGVPRLLEALQMRAALCQIGRLQLRLNTLVLLAEAA